MLIGRQQSDFFFGVEQICFCEFEVGDNLARMPCLCCFHRVSNISLLHLYHVSHLFFVNRFVYERG